MAQVKTFIQEQKKTKIEQILIRMWGTLGMKVPSNYEEIVEFCYVDVCEITDPHDWHEHDVVTAFNHWIEAQGAKIKIVQVLQCDTGVKASNGDVIREGQELRDAMQNTSTGLDGMYSNSVNTVAELRDAMQELSDDDLIVFAPCDEDGDEIDHFSMYIDVISGIQLTNGKTVNEVRFCQIPNPKPEPEPLSSVNYRTDLINRVMHECYGNDHQENAKNYERNMIYLKSLPNVQLEAKLS